MYQFNVPGTYYYWSGFVNYQLFSFRGVIQVNKAKDVMLDFSVTVNGFKGNLLNN